MKKSVALVLAGGPAPGINGVISAATIEAVNRGHRVFGIHKGFELIMQGDTTCMEELKIADISRIHVDGGSIIETSRANPRAREDSMERIISTLVTEGVGYLVTIGGDGTLASAAAISERAKGRIAVAHVPKTIDNDLPLPEKSSTFGFQTAREVGTDVTETLLRDAAVTSRFYLVLTMGRKAGHLALGIGLSAGATATIIPEDYHDRKIHISLLVDIIVGTIIKRIVMGRPHGVIVLAEGLAECLDATSISELEQAERDSMGFIRYAELDFGGLLRRRVRARLAEFGHPKLLVIDKNVGYELRCCAPNSFDREYSRVLGFGVIDFLLQGGTDGMISRQRDNLVPIPFSQVIDRKTGLTKVRYVDPQADVYRAAKKYMIRLTVDDLSNNDFVARAANLTNLTKEEFRKQFEESARLAVGYSDAYPGSPLERARAEEREQV